VKPSCADNASQKKGDPKAAFSKFETRKNQGLVGPSLLLPAAMTMPPITATAAIIATITPLPPCLLSSLVFAPMRFTLEAPTAFAAGERDSAITGALTSEAAATAARENLPKRIFVLLFCEVHCTRDGLLHKRGGISSNESPPAAKLSRFIEVLQISYNAGNISAAHKLNHVHDNITFRFWGLFMKIAIHQMCSGIDPAKNCIDMVEAVYQSSLSGAAMYFAPEMSLLLDRERGRASPNISAEPDNGALKKIAMAAKEASIWVHTGSVPVCDESSGKFTNRSIIIGPDGEIRARYDKMHLFDVNLLSGESWHESSVYTGGNGPVAVATPLGLMGLTICYDVRFPRLYAALIEAAVDVIAVPAAFTVPTGKSHWHTLLKARAIEAEAYVVAAAQSGLHEDGRQTFGHSLVVNPWGDVVIDMGVEPGLGFAEIDLARLAEVRLQIPVHKNRRNIDMPVRIL
jgi:deaminated glutathione amidase